MRGSAFSGEAVLSNSHTWLWPSEEQNSIRSRYPIARVGKRISDICRLDFSDATGILKIERETVNTDRPESGDTIDYGKYRIE